MIKIMKWGEVPPEKIFERNDPCADVGAAVSQIIADVKKRGDEALFEYTEKFDGVRPDSLAVTDAEIKEAFENTDPDFIRILKRAAENIKRFHTAQKRSGFEIKGEDGVTEGQLIIPVEKVGVYVPGGTAAYPSTVLMDTIPAKIAGCPLVVMATPPKKDGKIAPAILAAAKIAGVDKIYKIGGAQAIAALAYGTETVEKVYKIVGPGNAYVAEAKRQVFGKVSIDMIAGPSEILIIADEKTDPRHAAADLLSQAEHDKAASAVLVTDSEKLAFEVSEEIEKRIPKLPRAAIARASVDSNGKIIIASDLEKVTDIANEIAPEHLELCVDDPFALLPKIKNAGSVFMGRYCPEALGDYLAGPNHTLPTSGTAKFSSPLSVDDFIKKTQYVYYTEDALRAAAKDVARFAREEGLTAHAESALVRGEDVK